MPLYEINNIRPVIGEGTWIAPSAEIIGDVEIGRNCYIGFGAVIRGDFGKIVIGNGTLVEENVVIHSGSIVDIGDKVIIGHMVMIHDAVIKDRSLIGMKSMICDGAIIGEWTIIAEQSLVKKNQHIPSNKIFAGSPARKIGDLRDRHKTSLISGHKAYMEIISQYYDTFRRVTLDS
ncbi:MAG: gamma carbonic anhydrase family protein [Desulfobacterales bacterium]|nr:gamma carbonic anhydrase family protein [Desulfobacterales bacterium]